jgi:hypothetical protein
MYPINHILALELHRARLDEAARNASHRLERAGARPIRRRRRGGRWSVVVRPQEVV